MSGGGFVTHDQFKKAADYWKNKKQNAMPEEKLKKTVLEYINSNNIGTAIPFFQKFLRKIYLMRIDNPAKILPVIRLRITGMQKTALRQIPLCHL